MCNYKMDIKGSIGLSDYSNIYDYIGLVRSDDNFTISIHNVDKDNINIICSMLNDNKFVIHNQGYDSVGVYCIKACKIS